MNIPMERITEVLNSKNLITLQENLNTHSLYIQQYSIQKYNDMIKKLPNFSKDKPALNNRFYFSYDADFILCLCGYEIEKILVWTRFHRSDKHPESSFELQIKNGFLKNKFLVYNEDYPPKPNDLIITKDIPIKKNKLH